MKKINIRFIERCFKSGDVRDYLIQRKNTFGFWKYIGYTIDMGYGSVHYLYCNNTKEELLEEVLDKYYKVCDKYIQVVEHPSLKTY